METRQSDTVINDFVHNDGRKGWYEVRVYPSMEGILCIAKDITEQKQVEGELRKSRQQLEEALLLPISAVGTMIFPTTSLSGQMKLVAFSAFLWVRP